MNDNNLKGTMYIGGTYCIGGPKIAERLKAGEKIVFEDHDQHMEFILRTENRLRDQIIKAEPWIALDGAEINIKSDLDLHNGKLSLTIEAGEGRVLDMTLNWEQVSDLKDILQYAMNGFEAYDMLGRVQRVELPEEEDDNTKSAAARPVS